MVLALGKLREQDYVKLWVFCGNDMSPLQNHYWLMIMSDYNSQYLSNGENRQIFQGNKTILNYRLYQGSPPCTYINLIYIYIYNPLDYMCLFEQMNEYIYIQPFRLHVFV